MKKIRYLAFVLGLVLIPTIAAAETDGELGIAVVEKLHASLLNVMKEANSMGFGGRVDTLSPVVNETFDFSTISRIVTGKHWKSLNDEDKAAFVSLFSELSVATYAANFNGYSGEVFETVGVEEKRANLLVKSVIVKADGERIPLDYLLRKDNEVWRIVNVIADGVSDLSLKRADYTAVIKSEGFNSLITRLSDKIANYNSPGR